MHTLQADGIQLQFGLKKILTDVYLTCQTGNITGLLGKNGQGKSCLLNVIYGNLQPTSKSIRFSGTTIQLPYKHPDKLLYLPQFNFIPKSLTLKQVFNHFNVSFTGFQNLFPELQANYQTSIGQLSGGHVRLVELYVILNANTRFVLLDEPFTHIMPLHVQKIKQLMLAEKQNKGILVTDHLYKHIVDISDTIYVLANGKTHHAKTITDIQRLGYTSL
ncbi:MAG TPA: ATP-binding cassette domain-containing protein [Bacteroidia bacterium]|nr:ATP-binding cassette domain-containing protein [Bacteroidia bacterium]